jgi:hypothetical protein
LVDGGRTVRTGSAFSIGAGNWIGSGGFRLTSAPI